jgi:hypothetical protein
MTRFKVTAQFWVKLKALQEHRKRSLPATRAEQARLNKKPRLRLPLAMLRTHQ